MKKQIYLVAGALLMMFSACDDFLEKEPLDFGSDVAYFNKVGDMEIYMNNFYDLFPEMSSWYGGIYNVDNNSDNQAAHTPSQLFYKGDKQTPLQGQSEWNFRRIRDINYFIAKMEEKFESNSVAGTPDLIDHYMGEAYFFRAYEYFRLLSTIGDVPILTEVMDDNYEALVAASKRAPRNEVARFALSDLDKAIDMLLQQAPYSGRLSRDAALVMKGRVALYEGTWLKYHQGTALAPGNQKWPGAQMHPNFQFASGSIEGEYNWFFEQAYEAADQVASTRSLYDDYQKLFNRTSGIDAIEEVILARHYVKGIVSHSATHYLARTGGGTGLTRAFVDNFLLTNGMPIYADTDGLYQGDKMVHYVLQNRDLRLTNSVKDAGFIVESSVVNGETVNDTIIDYLPQIFTGGNQGSATGYELKKWVSYEEDQDLSGGGTTDIPIFRAAEAYLIYLEAYYERNGSLDSKCDIYWKALRNRAGVSDDYQATIAATDLSKESDLATKSHNQYVSTTLYNIRRERRAEFVAEGMRFKDLKRWRALDQMNNYAIEGINLWDTFYQYYNPDQIKPEIVSQSGSGKYIQPLRLNPSAIYYDGLSFPKAHYLEPIPVSEIIATSQNGDVTTSTIYQNPGWPSKIAGTAIYSADLD